MSDESCGCDATAIPATTVTPPIACSLDGDGMEARLGEWRAVLAGLERRESTGDGVRLVFGQPAPLAEISRLMAAEHACCPFFSFTLTVDNEGITLEVTVPADGQPLLEAVFGPPAG